MKKIYKYYAAALVAASLFGLSAQTANASTGYQRLTHNAYAYNYNGKRANHKLYRKGSRVNVIGSIILNGKKYNIIAGNLYIKAVNFNSKKFSATTDLSDGYETTLLHNAYIYNSNGQRVRGKKLLKNHDITYYGKVLKIKGKKYVQIGDNQYVRSSNVLLAYDGPISSDSPNKAQNSTSKQNNTSNNVKQNSAKTDSRTNTTSSNNSSSSKPDVNSSNKQNNQSTNANQNSNKTNTPTNQTPNTNWATDADYNELSQAIQKADVLKSVAYDSTFDKQKAYLNAMQQAEYCSLDRSSATIKHSSTEVQNIISNLNNAVANLDGRAIKAKMPKVTILGKLDGTEEYIWNPTTKQQALDIANQIHGSTDAHFINNTQIGLTDGDGYVQTFDAAQVINFNYETEF